MNTKSDLRICKTKGCNTILPKGYKHLYCEGCRNKQAHNTKKVMKGIVTGVTAVAGVTLAVITKGKIDLKKK